jgi:hypothetical protein
MSAIFQFPERDPGGVGLPLYQCGAVPPGSLCHVFSQKNWPKSYRIRHVFRWFSDTVGASDTPAKYVSQDSDHRLVSVNHGFVFRVWVLNPFDCRLNRFGFRVGQSQPLNLFVLILLSRGAAAVYVAGSANRASSVHAIAPSVMFRSKKTGTPKRSAQPIRKQQPPKT